MKNKDGVHLVLFFTFDVSLKTWKETGLLSRELRLYEEHARNGWKVTLLTYGLCDDAQYLDDNLSDLDVVPLYGGSMPRSALIRLLLSPLLLIRAMTTLRTADVIKTNQIWGGWNAVLASRIFGVPLIARGGYEPVTFSKLQQHSRLRQIFVGIVSKLAYINADRVVMATQEDANAVATVTPTCASKTIVKGNWIDVASFQPKGSSKSTDEILFVGRLTRQKNLETLIAAISRSNFRLSIIGSGELEERLRELSKRRDAKVTFLGNLQNSEVAEQMAQFEIFVLPSLFEGNPKVLLEAMASGMAIVANDAPGINTLIEHEKSGYLVSNNSDEFTMALKLVSSEMELRSRMGESARKWVVQNASLRSYVEFESALVGQLLQDRRMK